MAVLHIGPPETWTKRFLIQLKTVSYLVFTLLVITIFIPVCAVISYALWLVALLMSLCDSTLGRFVTSLDAWMDEDFTENLPRSSIITTMTLEGTLALEQLQALFTANVLEAKLSGNLKKLRYPELKQYLTRFMGFRVWKDDPDFHISNHIAQKVHQGPLDMSVIHQELINKPYSRNHSPWEIILINSVSTTGVETSVVAARLHHAMADGKSILKLFVECLGQKSLKTAQATPAPTSYLSSFQFYLMFPLHYIIQMTFVFYKFCTSHKHPWKNHGFRGDKYSRINVSFSPKLPLSEIKQVAKKNNVTSSAVVMSLVAGAMRKCGVDFEDHDVIMGYPLPKDNHPESMANHVYMGIMPLPTNQGSSVGRLQTCNKIFSHAKTSQLGRYTNITALQSGTLIHPLAKRLAVNHFVPMFLTNIAGEQDGFRVGNVPCTDFRMTVGTLEGVGSVIFCAFSYKDSMYVGVTAKESIMSCQQTEKLANDLSKELLLLASI